MSRRTPVVVPVSPVMRVLRALASLLLLAGLIAGLPVALALLAGNPLDRLPATDGIWETLTSPDDGSLFLAVLTVVGWLAWAAFTCSVALELFARLTRRRTPSIPGLGGTQRIAAVLVAAIAAIAVTPTVASASAAMVAAPPAAVVTPLDPDAVEEKENRAMRVSADVVIHTVERGEGLLDLQDRYGVAWQRIAEANYGVEQPDGRSLQRGQTRIYPGWQMRIPFNAAADPALRGMGTAPGAPATVAGFGAAADESPAVQQQYVVAQGDWLWHISERYLGDPERYQEIAELNPEYADRHGDFPDHIEPGWTLQLPADAVDRGPIPHAMGTATASDSASADLAPEDSAQEEPAAPEQLDPPTPPDPADPPEADPVEDDPGDAPKSPPAASDSTPGTPPDEASEDASAEAPSEPPPMIPPTPPVEPSAPPTDSPGAERAAATPAPEKTVPQPAGPHPSEPAMVGMGAAPDLPSGVDPTPGGSDPATEKAPSVRGGIPTTSPDHGPNTETADKPGMDLELERLAPAALTGAGLLTALVLGAAGYQLHRRHQHHRAGFRLLPPASRRLEKVLRSAAQPLDTLRLDAALRHLAAALADRTDDLPDVAGALIDGGSVHLLLAAPCPNPPDPWRAHDDRWTLPAGATLPVTVGGQRLAPLPTLATVGSQAGFHLLLDLERIGYLTIHGDPTGALDLLRYIAAELACNTWSDTTEVLLAGFPAREAQLLTTLAPERIRALPSVGDAVGMLQHRIASARATLGHTGAADALAGRLHGVAGDAWMPQVLLAAASSAADLAALAALEQSLQQSGSRCAVAVATTDTDPSRAEQGRVTVTPDGTVHVRLPFLRGSLAAAALTLSELEPLAETMHAARSSRMVPVPPAAEPDLWAAGTDAAGAVRGVGVAPLGRTPDEIPTPVVPLPRAASDQFGADDTLDEDLRAWRTEPVARPRISILGPVSVQAAGVPPEQQPRLHAELVVFLAQRAGRGADAQLIDSSLWPEVRVTDAARQVVISQVRRWLGTDPQGRPWLPDLDADLVYRLAEGYLCDWHLFRRLRSRAQLRGTEGTGDLRAALELVRGVPLAGADQPAAPGARNPYPWLPESDIHPDHLVATIVDTAHEFAERCLAVGDPEGVRWAVQQAWLADPQRSYDQPWRDLLRAEHSDGRTDQLRMLLAELMAARGAETPSDLAPETYQLISCWPPNVLIPTTN